MSSYVQVFPCGRVEEEGQSEMRVIILEDEVKALGQKRYP